MNRDERTFLGFTMPGCRTHCDLNHAKIRISEIPVSDSAFRFHESDRTKIRTTEMRLLEVVMHICTSLRAKRKTFLGMWISENKLECEISVI